MPSQTACPKRPIAGKVGYGVAICHSSSIKGEQVAHRAQGSLLIRDYYRTPMPGAIEAFRYEYVDCSADRILRNALARISDHNTVRANLTIADYTSQWFLYTWPSPAIYGWHCRVSVR